jgi:hypothetical protein
MREGRRKKRLILKSRELLRQRLNQSTNIKRRKKRRQN